MKKKHIKIIKCILFYLLVFLIIIVCIAPFFWQLLTSFRPDKYMSDVLPLFSPEQTFQHYINVFTKRPFLKFIRNSVVVALSSSIASIIIGSFAAYSLSRLKIKGRKVILASILIASMLPQIAIVTSLYLFLKDLNLLNSYIGLVIPYTTFTLPLTIWILANAFNEIPWELEEAAKIDGCTPFSTYYKIILPLAAPAIFTAEILTFIFAWNEFLFALTFTSTPARQTIPVAIAMFPAMYHVPWGDLAAASVIVTMPLIIMVFFFQKKIISGLTSGSVKG